MGIADCPATVPRCQGDGVDAGRGPLVDGTGRSLPADGRGRPGVIDGFRSLGWGDDTGKDVGGGGVAIGGTDNAYLAQWARTASYSHTAYVIAAVVAGRNAQIGITTCAGPVSSGKFQHCRALRPTKYDAMVGETTIHPSTHQISHFGRAPFTRRNWDWDRTIFRGAVARLAIPSDRRRPALRGTVYSDRVQTLL